MDPHAVVFLTLLLVVVFSVILVAALHVHYWITVQMRQRRPRRVVQTTQEIYQVTQQAQLQIENLSQQFLEQYFEDVYLNYAEQYSQPSPQEAEANRVLQSL